MSGMLTAALLACGMFAQNAAAVQTSFTWSGSGTSNNWTTGSNWVGNIAPSTSATGTFVFNNTLRLTNTNTIGSLTATNMSFVNGAGAFTLSGSAINFGSITNSSANNQTLSLTVNQTTSGTYDASSNITLSGSLTGSGNITKTGAGTLALNGVNKAGYTGTITVSDGTLQIGTAAASTASMAFAGVILQNNTTLSTGNGGTLTLKSLEIAGSTVTLPANTLGFIGGGLKNSSGGNLTVINNVSFAGNSTIDAGAGGMQLAGAVGGSGTTSSVGSGLLELTNSSNGFTGQFNVNSGTTRLAAGVSAEFVVANGATLESSVGGVGSVNSLVLQNGASLLPGTAGGIGSITANTDVTMASTSTVQFDIAGVAANDPGAGGVDYDQVNFGAGFSSGVLTYNGSLDFNFTTATAFDNGTSFQLFSAGGVGTSIAGDLVGINPTTGGSYNGLTFTDFASTIQFEKDYFNLVAGDWISTWNGVGHQRLIFSQSSGTLTVVPEPSTIVFAGIGLAMFGWSTWTRRRANARRQVIEASVA
jgi:autotransporter-associated beta strand protein